MTTQQRPHSDHRAIFVGCILAATTAAGLLSGCGSTDDATERAAPHSTETSPAVDDSTLLDVGGDFLEVTGGPDDVLHVRIDDLRVLTANESGFDERTVLATVRIENRLPSGSDGLIVRLECDNVDTYSLFGDSATLDANYEPVAGDSFIEGTMLLPYPQDCVGARVEASHAIAFTGDDSARTAIGWKVEL
jgi:hypothetical protein